MRKSPPKASTSTTMPSFTSAGARCVGNSRESDDGHRGTDALSPEKQSFDSGESMAKTSLKSGRTSLSQKATTV